MERKLNLEKFLTSRRDFLKAMLHDIQRDMAEGDCFTSEVTYHEYQGRLAEVETMLEDLIAGRFEGVAA